MGDILDCHLDIDCQQNPVFLHLDDHFPDYHESQTHLISFFIIISPDTFIISSIRTNHIPSTTCNTL